MDYVFLTLLCNIIFCVFFKQPEVPESSAEPETGDGVDDGDNEPSTSSSVSGVLEGKKRKRPRTQTRMDEALLKFLESPRESEIMAQKVFF